MLENPILPTPAALAHDSPPAQGASLGVAVCFYPRHHYHGLQQRQVSIADLTVRHQPHVADSSQQYRWRINQSWDLVLGGEHSVSEHPRATRCLSTPPPPSPAEAQNLHTLQDLSHRQLAAFLSPSELRISDIGRCRSLEHATIP